MKTFSLSLLLLCLFTLRKFSHNLGPPYAGDVAGDGATSGGEDMELERQDLDLQVMQAATFIAHPIGEKRRSTDSLVVNESEVA